MADHEISAAGGYGDADEYNNPAIKQDLYTRRANAAKAVFLKLPENGFARQRPLPPIWVYRFKTGNRLSFDELKLVDELAALRRPESDKRFDVVAAELGVSGYTLRRALYSYIREDPHPQGTPWFRIDDDEWFADPEWRTRAKAWR